MITWFTADWHLGHANVIKYCNRPFYNTDKMRHALMSNYRKSVGQDDLVYFVGDMTLAGPAHKSFIERFMEELPGRKILILGNHDKLHAFDYLDCGFESVHTSLEIPEGYILCHDPAKAIMRSDKTWLCGHTHHLFKTLRNIISVSVENWEYFPASLVEIQTLEKTLKKMQRED